MLQTLQVSLELWTYGWPGCVFNVVGAAQQNVAEHFLGISAGILNLTGRELTIQLTGCMFADACRQASVVQMVGPFASLQHFLVSTLIYALFTVDLKHTNLRPPPDHTLLSLALDVILMNRPH